MTGHHRPVTFHADCPLNRDRSTLLTVARLIGPSGTSMIRFPIGRLAGPFELMEPGPQPVSRGLVYAIGLRPILVVRPLALFYYQ